MASFRAVIVGMTASSQPQLSRSDFAWEFLRRNPRYRAVARARSSTRAFDDHHGEEVARPWGLQFVADPSLPAQIADVFWRPEIAPALVVTLEPSLSPAASPLRLGGAVALQRKGSDGLHLKLRSGIQAVVREGDLSTPLAVVLPISGQFSASLRAARSLHRALAGAPAPLDDLTPQQHLRLERTLVALDGAASQQSYRDIACQVFGHARVSTEAWRTSSVRDAAIRLVRAGRRLMDGGYLRLLAPDNSRLADDPQ